MIAGCYNPDGPGASKLRSEYKAIQIVKIDVTSDDSVDKALSEVEKSVESKGRF